MKSASSQVQRLEQQLNAAETLEANILQQLEKVQHQVGDTVEQLTRLNNRMAKLELSEEADQTLAVKIDQLRTELALVDDAYRALLIEASKLQQAELESTQKLHDARSELKTAQLKAP